MGSFPDTFVCATGSARNMPKPKKHLRGLPPPPVISGMLTETNRKPKRYPKKLCTALLNGMRPPDLPPLALPAFQEPARRDTDELAEMFTTNIDDTGSDYSQSDHENEGWETEDEAALDEETEDVIQEEPTPTSWAQQRQKRREQWPKVWWSAVPAVARELAAFISSDSKCFNCENRATLRCQECSRHHAHVRDLLLLCVLIEIE